MEILVFLRHHSNFTVVPPKMFEFPYHTNLKILAAASWYFKKNSIFVKTYLLELNLSSQQNFPYYHTDTQILLVYILPFLCPPGQMFDQYI